MRKLALAQTAELCWPCGEEEERGKRESERGGGIDFSFPSLETLSRVGSLCLTLINGRVNTLYGQT